MGKLKKLYETFCRKCGGETRIRWIPSLGMDIEPTGMKRTCIVCGFEEFIDSLERNDKN